MNAFFDAVLNISKTVGNKFKGCTPGEIFDRKHRFENSLQTNVSALFGRYVHLQKPLKRFPLHPDQVRDTDNLLYLAEILPYALVCQKSV
jgi:hypothetical protein